jgi:two-component system, OmpR family, response regulator
MHGNVVPLEKKKLPPPHLNNRVIVVEKDDELAREIGLALASQALSVVRLRSTELLLKRRVSASAILLDPLVDGSHDSLHVLRKMRSNGDRTPVIIVSALRGVAERVRGLQAGADDCLDKPFAMAELMARVEAARRRYDMVRSTQISSGSLRLDRLNRILYKNGSELELLPREFELLEYFMLNEGIVLSRSSLLEKVWKTEGSTQTNVVDVSIGNLRKKIEGDKRLIINKRGLGFRFGDIPVESQHFYTDRDVEAKIELSGRFYIKCWIKDLSASGCRLRIPAAIDIPGVFDLIIPIGLGADQRCRAKIRWRKADMLAGKFITPYTV